MTAQGAVSMVADAATTNWTPDSREVPAELQPNFDHAIYTPVFFPPLADRLPAATRDMLLAMAKGTL